MAIATEQESLGPRALVIVTGPARSGKSEWAEGLAEAWQTVIYVATSSADPEDVEWQARLDLHRQRRPAHWQLQEVPVDLAGAIAAAPERSCLLIDSLGTWLANLLDQDENQWQSTLETLKAALAQRQSAVIMVAEETGWGVVPAYPVGRLFRDRLGTAVRSLGAIADAVYLVTGGYALNLAQLGTPLTLLAAADSATTQSKD